MLYSECVDGGWTCTERVCSATCALLGRRMVKTFDNVYYEHSDSCEIAYVEVCLMYFSSKEHFFTADPRRE